MLRESWRVPVPLLDNLFDKSLKSDDFFFFFFLGVGSRPM